LITKEGPSSSKIRSTQERGRNSTLLTSIAQTVTLVELIVIFTQLVQRIQEELILMATSPSTIYSARPQNKSLDDWTATIVGPSNTPYEGGLFQLLIKFTPDYPRSPPQVRFLTEIYHMNIAEDGFICLDILDKSKRWNPDVTVPNILMALFSLLIFPNPDDPLNYVKAQQFKNDKDSYDKCARDWTLQFAK